MGLHIKNDEIDATVWSGGYRHFNDFRRAVARASGKKFPLSSTELEVYSQGNLLGIWEKAPDDSLDIFLIHSDSEGYIHSYDADHVADRLEGLGETIDQEWAEALEMFVKGLRAHADANCNVEFQ